MSDASSFDFSKFVPGFDFLKNLSGTGAQTGLPSASAWIAPTLDPDELDKRIQELKTVHFWLDQNTKAVSATIQALEVQKMTLATLRGMNMSMSDLAESLKIKPDTMSSVFSSPDADSPSATAEVTPQTDQHATAPEQPASKPRTRPMKKPREAASSANAAASAPTSAAQPGGVDPMAWWGALTQQFQHIANQAVQDLQRQPPAGADAPAQTTSTRRAAKGTARGRPQGARNSATKASSGNSGKGTSPSSSSKSKPARKSAHSAARHRDT